MRMQEGTTIQLLDDFNEATEEWIYLRFINKSGYSYYEVPDNAPYNPWAYTIYSQVSPVIEDLFTIFPDGRINTLRPEVWNYRLIYSNSWENIVFKLVRNDAEIAEVLFKIDWDFIME